MRFSSLPFLFGFLPLTLALYFAAPPRWRNLVLLLTSLVFYGWGEPVYLGIMVLSILIDYTHGLLVERYRSRDKLARWFVAESVILNLGLLGFFKYWDFFAENLSRLPGITLPALGLPLRIAADRRQKRLSRLIAQLDALLPEQLPVGENGILKLRLQIDLL